MAKMTGAEMLRWLRAEADRITALGAGLRDRIDTLTNPTAAEAEVEAVRAAAEQRAATADRLRAGADAAAEEMSEHLTAAQTLAHAVGQSAVAAKQDRDAAIARARAEAGQPCPGRRG